MRIIFVSLFFFLTLILNAQTNIYLADLAALKSVVEKTTSFKAQMKGDKLSYYNDLYKRLASDTTNAPNSYKYFYNLA